jgi:hypothetical protein
MNPTNRLHVASMGPRAKRWLEETRRAHVLYAFERVVDLVNQEGDVLSLAENSIGDGPFSLVLEEGPFPESIKIESNLLVFENGLWLDDWLIDAENATLWAPRPDWEGALRNPGTLKSAVETIAELLSAEAKSESLAQLILNPTYNSPLPARILQIAEQNIPYLISGIEDGDTDAIRKSAKALAGIGPGLTPAGDDLLLGAMHGIWATRSENVALNLCQAIVNAAAPRTHALSGAWLMAGAAGEAAEPWHLLISAIGIQSTPAVKAAANRILPTGHTSGADALGGFLAVVRESI